MMQLHISDRLVRDPQSKTSAAGKPYLSAMAAVGAGDKEALVTLMVRTYAKVVIEGSPTWAKTGNFLQHERHRDTPC